MNKTEQLFDELFKYQGNQELRHKGDTKGSIADMGLFVLSRYLVETTDDDGKKLYERSYMCRMVKFSGSGETAHFREKELMTVDEYNQRSTEEETKRNRRREEARQIQDEIYKAFGVDERTELYLKKDGKVDKSVIYKVSGFIRSKKDGTELHLRKVAGMKFGDERTEVKSKDEFEIVMQGARKDK